MTAVLGIDAAWTEKNPSGVALAVKGPSGWTLARASPSYADFLADRPLDRPRGGPAPVAALIAAASLIAPGTHLALVAVDMPLSREPITGRRVSDNQVSRAFGAMKCGTHSPNAERPGPIADNMTRDFAALGYALAPSAPLPPKALIEVYPHPALVRLCAETERLPYKHAKIGAYWPELSRSERLDALRGVWKRIVTALDVQLAGAAERLPPPPPAASTWRMKAFEDTLDAAVCCWIGVCVLEGRAGSFGDETSAIWAPHAL